MKRNSGQLFCDHSAQEIVNLLVDECSKSASVFQLGYKAEKIEKKEHFVVNTNKEIYECESLIIATGGLSIPQIGATGFGYDVARQFGLSIVETAPALDGFNFKKDELSHFEALAGVSIDTTVSCNGATFRENILFTHTGLSGPASLQVSLYWKRPMPLKVNLFPDADPVLFLNQMRREKPKA